MSLLKVVILFFYFISSLRASDIGFIYVNANTGQSSGGHSAFLIGENVYHFQLFEDGIFHLVREPFSSFQTIYGEIENRSIYIHFLDLDKSKVQQIQDFWNEAYILQQAELTKLENLENDWIFYKTLSENKNLKLKSLGYFDKDFSNPKKFSVILFKINISKLNEYIKNLDSNLYQNSSSSNFILNFLYYDFARNVILNGYELKSDSYFEIPISLIKSNKNINKISNWEGLYFQKLQKYKLELEENTLNTLLNPNLYQARGLVMSLARLSVLEKSLKDKKIYFLNSFSNSYAFLPYKKLSESKNKNLLQNQFEDLFVTELESFLKKEINSRTYSLLEDRANRYFAFWDSITNQKDLKLTFELLLPSREGEIVYSWKFTKQDLEEKTLKAKQTYENYKKNLQTKYPFQLIKRNCTTEIFSFLNQIIENNPQKSKEFYGGYIDTKNNLNFIPFIAYDSVKQKYNTRYSIYFPSYRIRYLNEISKKKDWKKFFIESNTLSSEIYEFNDEDGWFLFFTDEPVALRPIFGAFNLGVSVLELGYGIIKLPLDKGKKLESGAMNFVFSFPELFFMNVRKGNFLWRIPSSQEKQPKPQEE